MYMVEVFLLFSVFTIRTFIKQCQSSAHGSTRPSLPLCVSESIKCCWLHRCLSTVSTRWSYLGAVTKVIVHFPHNIDHISPLRLVLVKYIQYDHFRLCSHFLAVCVCYMGAHTRHVLLQTLDILTNSSAYQNYQILFDALDVIHCR